MSSAEVRTSSVKHTLSLAIEIGQTIRRSRAKKKNPFEAFSAFMACTSYSVARRIFEGKIIDVDRQTSQRFTLGSAKIAGDGNTDLCTIEFQNENLIARADGEMLAIVPDIISVLDAETAVPITNETLRYGQRVAVMALRVPEIMRSEAALAQFGPAAFGMDKAYVPLSAD